MGAIRPIRSLRSSTVDMKTAPPWSSFGSTFFFQCMQINKNQITDIDENWSKLIRTDLQRSLLINISDQFQESHFYRSA